MTRLACALLTLLLLLPGALAARGGRIAVIVHPSRGDALDRSLLTQIYLRQRQFWASGEQIVPINQPAGSPIREEFSRAVCGGDSQFMSDYWNRQYFQGVFPPATLSSEIAVKLYVAGDPKAIGYVEEHAVDATVRVALWLEPARAIGPPKESPASPPES